MAKWYKMCVLYILYGFLVIGQASLDVEDFHDNNKLWNFRSRNVSERRINKGLEVILE